MAALAAETEQEIQEREHFQRIVNVFKSYKFLTDEWIKRKIGLVKSFSAVQQRLLSDYTKQLAEMRVCVAHNAEVVQLIINDVENMFENVQHEEDSKLSVKKRPILRTDLEKVYTTLRQVVRDWSSEGAAERELCYRPILDAIDKAYPKDKIDRSCINILVPGAGLGRLSYELASRGYSCQGNEFSLFMLFASNFVLNRSSGVDSLRIYPWVHSVNNVLSPEDQLRPVAFPDVNPSDLPPNSQLTMAAGDFLEIYTEPDSWDCVATCFFIDCASNIVSFVQTIYKILKPGGQWVNLGPLLYHYAEQEEEDSIEPSYDHLISIVRKIGFIISEERTDVPTSYAQNPNSMLKTEYQSVFFIASKPHDTVCLTAHVLNERRDHRETGDHWVQATSGMMCEK
ncbi:N2227-like [Trinorchestia longiramus]|nr:N2227-like [Trinorchestia longiramus]